MYKTELYIETAVAGILGILFHIFVIKIPGLRARAKVANERFSFSQYLADDYPGIVASFVTLALAILALDEVIGYRPSLLKFIKYFYFFVGYTGSSILLAVLSKTSKAINAIVDTKTDELKELKKP